MSSDQSMTVESGQITDNFGQTHPISSYDTMRGFGFDGYQTSFTPNNFLQQLVGHSTLIDRENAYTQKLKKDVKTLKDEVETLKTITDPELRRRNRDLNKEVEDLKKKIETMERSHERMKTEHDRVLSQSSDEKDRIIADLQTELKMLRDNLKKVGTEAEDDIEVRDQIIKDRDKEIKDLKEQIANIRDSGSSDENARVVMLQQEVNNLNTIIRKKDELLETNKQLKDRRIIKLESDLKEQLDTNANLTNQLEKGESATLKQNLKLLDENKKLQNQLDKAISDYTKLQGDLEKTVNAGDQSITTLNTRLEAAEKQRNDFGTQLNELRIVHAGIRSQLEKKDNEITDLKRDLESARKTVPNDLQKLKEEKGIIQEEYNKLENMLKEKVQENKKLQKDFESARKTVSEDIRKLNQEKDKIQEKYNKLEEQLKDKVQENKKLQDVLTELSDQNKKFVQTIKLQGETLKLYKTASGGNSNASQKDFLSPPPFKDRSQSPDMSQAQTSSNGGGIRGAFSKWIEGRNKGNADEDQQSLLGGDTGDDASETSTVKGNVNQDDSDDASDTESVKSNQTVTQVGSSVQFSEMKNSSKKSPTEKNKNKIQKTTATENCEGIHPKIINALKNLEDQGFILKPHEDYDPQLSLCDTFKQIMQPAWRNYIGDTTNPDAFVRWLIPEEHKLIVGALFYALRCKRPPPIIDSTELNAHKFPNILWDTFFYGGSNEEGPQTWNEIVDHTPKGTKNKALWIKPDGFIEWYKGTGKTFDGARYLKATKPDTLSSTFVDTYNFTKKIVKQQLPDPQVWQVVRYMAFMFELVKMLPNNTAWKLDARFEPYQNIQEPQQGVDSDSDSDPEDNFKILPDE